MYHKNGDQDTARARYIELSKKTKEAINPFLLYTGNIDNDNDLIIFEKLMASYFSE